MDNRRKVRTVIGRDLVEPAASLACACRSGSVPPTNQNTEGTCHSAPNDPKSSLALHLCRELCGGQICITLITTTFQNTETGSGSSKAEHDPLIVPGGGCSMWV